MKKIYPIASLICMSCMMLQVDLSGQNIGISNATPNAPLSFANASGNKIDLFYNSATSRYGFGIQAGLLQMFSNGPTGDIAFGQGSSASFIELMRIKGSGTVGIGNTSPDDAGLVVDKKVGAVNAMFGRNTTGVAIESSFPGIGLNSYYNGGRKTIAAGYTALIGLDPVNGNLSLNNSNVSTATDAAVTLFTRLFINKDGDIGVEGNTAPHAPLSFANTVGSKISLYGSTETSNYGLGIQGSLLQLYSNISSSDIAFGYGGSTSFTENMRIRGNGNVGIGENVPLWRLDVKNSTSLLLRLVNSTTLSGNVNVDLFFKTGTLFTGAIKTIGENVSEARLGFFTNASTGSSNLLERMSILDNGYVGIGTTTPAVSLDVVSSTQYAGRFVNNYTSGGAVGLIGKAPNDLNATGVLGEGYQVGVDGEATGVGSGIRYGVVGNATGGSTNWAGYFFGSVYATGSFVPSDRKLKNDIRPITDALSIINRFKPSVYTYKTTEFEQMHLPEGTQYGLIADEVAQVIPDAVKKAVQPARYENHDIQHGRKLNDEVEFNAVNYTAVIPILISAVQEQQKQIDVLLKHDQEQQQQIDELEKLVEALITKDK